MIFRVLAGERCDNEDAHTCLFFFFAMVETSG